MTTTNDPAEALRALGFRASAEALRALLAHATKDKLSPAEVCLELTALESASAMHATSRRARRRRRSAPSSGASAATPSPIP